MPILNRQLQLASRPRGEPTARNFRLVEAPLPALAAGQVLVKHRYLSLDPYMRGRMNDAKSYAPPQPLDQVMIGGTAGEVIESRHARFAPGDQVVGLGGWQEYAVVDADREGALRKVDVTRVPLSAHLGALGMPGVAAWYGLTKVIAPRAGETIVVSSAAGAVGGAAGQLAKARGCRVVGIAGGPEKCGYVVDELGFDDCIDHRRFADLKAMSGALKAACPAGIDGCFENVGGVSLDAVLLRGNAFARIAVCGMMAGLNGDPIPMTVPQRILVNRMKLEGFIVTEHMEMWPEALDELGALAAAGGLRWRESIACGLDSAPQAFIDLLRGENRGKQLVRFD
ncbi:MAG: NADP-dependent oxidoreductase [Burkholderiaceae bacterium]